MLWNLYPGNLSGELCDFVVKYGGWHWKKLKLSRDPHVDAPLRKILKYQTEVDNNPWWLVPVSFLYDNLYWNKLGVFHFFLTYTVPCIDYESFPAWS